MTFGPALAASIAGARAVHDERCRRLAELGHDPPPDDDEALGPWTPNDASP